MPLRRLTDGGPTGCLLSLWVPRRQEAATSLQSGAPLLGGPVSSPARWGERAAPGAEKWGGAGAACPLFPGAYGHALRPVDARVGLAWSGALLP